MAHDRHLEVEGMQRVGRVYCIDAPVLTSTCSLHVLMPAFETCLCHTAKLTQIAPWLHVLVNALTMRCPQRSASCRASPTVGPAQPDSPRKLLCPNHTSQHATSQAVHLDPTPPDAPTTVLPPPHHHPATSTPEARLTSSSSHPSSLPWPPCHPSSCHHPCRRS